MIWIKRQYESSSKLKLIYLCDQVYSASTNDCHNLESDRPCTKGDMKSGSFELYNTIESGPDILSKASRYTSDVDTMVNYEKDLMEIKNLVGHCPA